nr:hypothetical protein [Tanacetum cinerariifolium]
MATTIEQQTALDESLIPSLQRLRIGRSNFRLSSDIQSKEATLQVVYDVLRNSPLFRAFQVTADVPEIYMQEFWATTKLHHTSIRFKINSKKSVLNLTEAEQLKIVLKRSRRETHISQQSGSSTDEGTGSKPGVPDVPSDDSEEELSEEEEVSFDPIPRTPKDSEKESDDEDEQESRLSEEARIQEEEDAEELYRNVNINQGRGLQVTQSVEDTHPPTPIMTPSTIATITTSGEAPIPPPTIPSIILENLPTFNSAFRFEERLRLLETSFYEYRQTNRVADAVSAIPGIVHQYMDQQMKEAVRE